MFPFALILSLIISGVPGCIAWAQAPQPPPAGETKTSASLPLTSIVLYSSGVGYFQREGAIDGHNQVALRFKVENINDLLKSMTVQDFDGGQITAVTYDSRDPVTRTLKSFAVDLTDHPTLGQLLQQIRGEQVEVATPNAVRGIIVGVETKREPVGNDKVVEVEYLNLLTDTGLRAIALPHIQHLQLTNTQLSAELQQALAVLASSHDRQKKTVMLTFDGTGQRRVRVAYIIATPVWKTSYRLVLTDNEAPFLQGWALVENTTDEDWQDVRLSLMSGRPISFVMDMYEPLYAQRPVVVPEVYASLRPQVYEQAIEAPGDTLREAHLQDKDEPAAPGRKQHETFYSSLERPKASAAPAPPLPVSPAPRALALSQGVATAAQAVEAGELFEYAITTPVSLARQKSAMLPIVNEPVQGTRLSIYNQRAHAKHPLNGFRLRNATALHLLQGPITVFDAGRYAGDARLDDLPPGQERLISYALDLKSEVEPLRAAEQQELVAVSLRKGTLHATQKASADTTYNIKNRDQKSKLVLIEHPFRAEWQLITPSTPAERTRDAYRLAVTVDAGQGAQLKVREERPIEETIVLTDAGIDVIAYYLHATRVSAPVREALKKVVALRERLDQTRQQRLRLEERLQEIAQEQERLRQNMGQLGQKSELYSRYVRKLDQQETELEALQRQIETLKRTEDEQQRELETYVLQLDIG
jgi:hypothetical protein